VVHDKELLVFSIAYPVAELRQGPASGSANILALRVKLLNKEGHQVLKVQLNLTIRAILVRNGSKRKNSSLLVVEIVAL